MGKHKKKGQFHQNLQAAQPSPSGGQPAPAETPPQAPGSEAAGPEISAPTVSKTYFFTFWGLIVIAVAVAWTLAVLMPNVPESLIERWIMLGLACALGILLIIFK
ncbi:MAG: hypothetical protein KKH28_15345 [Elusimicrobia bacterium]|nr:hypothetical protein [Elusimicrobiota bacterium]